MEHIFVMGSGGVILVPNFMAISSDSQVRLTYTSQIYLRSQLRIYWCYFYYLCSQHVL
jgi:hypothetical protein